MTWQRALSFTAAAILAAGGLALTLTAALAPHVEVNPFQGSPESRGVNLFMGLAALFVSLVLALTAPRVEGEEDDAEPAAGW